MGTGDSSKHDRKPVYIPFKTFLTAVDCLKTGIPPTLDRSVWPSFAGGTQSHTLGAFKFLTLIEEDGSVNPVLEELVSATEEARKNLLKTILQDKYDIPLKLGQTNASFHQLIDHFKTYDIHGSTLETAIRFFLDACIYVGERRSPHWAKAIKRIKRTPRKGGSSAKETKTETMGQAIPPTEGQPTINIKAVSLRSGGSVSLSLSVDLLSLSAEDRTWLFDLVDKLNAYEKEESKKESAED